MSTIQPTRHVDQNIPIEWGAFEVAGETLIAHDVTEWDVALYRVVGETANPRAMILADALLYEGNIVEPYSPNRHTVELQHCYAGRMGRYLVTEWLDEPVVRLERVEPTDLEDNRDG